MSIVDSEWKQRKGTPKELGSLDKVVKMQAIENEQNHNSLVSALTTRQDVLLIIAP